MDLQADITAPTTAQDCPPSDLLLSQVHSLIDALGKATPRLMGQAKDSDEEAPEADGEQKQVSLQMSNALHTVNDLWQRNIESWTLNCRNAMNSRVDVS